MSGQSNTNFTPSEGTSQGATGELVGSKERKQSTSSIGGTSGKERRGSESFSRQQDKMSSKMEELQKKREAELERANAAFGNK